MPRPYKSATCRGSYALGTACGRCERCADEMAATSNGVLHGHKGPPGWTMTTEEKLVQFERGDGSVLNTKDAGALLRAVRVLRRIAVNDCTNAQREAADILCGII